MSNYSSFGVQTSIPLQNNYARAPPIYNTYRFYSSIQTQRSRVFARQEERFPPVTKQSYFDSNRPAGRQTGVLRTENAEPKNIRQGTLFSAPQPAGKSTVKHLPAVQQKISSVTNSPSKNSNKSRNDKFIVSQIAGVSSKEHEVQMLRAEKMASGWAEARAGHTIPHLRDSIEHDKVGGESVKDHSPTGLSNHTKDHSSTGRSTTDQVDVVDSKHNTEAIRKQPDKHGSRQSLVRKSTDEAESTGSVSDKPAAKKVQKQTSKVSHVKSKGSSGYGSMGSNSQHGHAVADNKNSIFKPSTQNEALAGSEKQKLLTGVYKSSVKVEQNHGKVSAKPAEHDPILTEREAGMYIHLKSTYQQSAEQERERRKENFFKKLQNIQIDSALQHNREVQNKTAKKEQAKRRQLEQLAQIRNKFEEDRQKRYKSQYVTKNFLDYERMNREEYGLPEKFTSKTHYQAKLRAGGGKVTALDFIKREVKLKKNYSKMFAKPSTGKKATVSEPRMEGKDKLTIKEHDADGNPVKGKRVDVKVELREAEDMLKHMEEDSPRESSESKSQKQPTKTKPVTSKVPVKPTISVTSEKPKDSKTITASSTSSHKAAPQTVITTSDDKRSDTLTKNSLKLPDTDYSSSAAVSKRPGLDTLSVHSKISVITEESEAGDDFYEKLMAKYGIELSDDDDDDY